jgi:hypothetical protein
MKHALCCFLLMLLAGTASAADYYVATSGDDSNSGLRRSPWKTIARANRALEAGDTVYIMPGEYRDQIAPTRSGTSERYIIYRGYGQEPPVITGSPGRIAIMLDNRSYVRITGIVVDGKGVYRKSNLDGWIRAEQSDHIIIQDSSFKNAKGWTAADFDGSHYSKILNNRFDTVGTNFDPNHKGDPMAGDMLTLHCADHNLIEGNYFTRAGHSLMVVDGNYNIVRKNVFENKWSDQSGYRALALTANMRYCERAVGHTLFEKNVVKNSFKPYGETEKGESAMKVEGVGQIVRKNLYYNNYGWATTSAIRPPRIPRSENNRIYNNTIVKNAGLWSLREYGAGEAVNNIFQNNLVTNSTVQDVSGDDNEGNRFIANALRPSSGKSLYAYTVKAAPSFVANDPSLDGAFHLKPDSVMIDAGQYLTKTTKAGSGKIVPVNDAGWFSDGFSIVDGDLVRIGNNNPVRVVQVDYEANILVLKSPISWSNGARVSLPYSGAAPDIGAFEYQQGITLGKSRAPTGLAITKG